MKNRMMMLFGLVFVSLFHVLQSAEYPYQEESNKASDMDSSSSSSSSSSLLLLYPTYSFESYVRDYQKVYSSREEYNVRKHTFEQNLKRIRQHNQQNYYRTYDNSIKNKKEQQQPQQQHVSYYQMGINEFTDRHEWEIPLGKDKTSMYRNNAKRQEAWNFYQQDATSQIHYWNHPHHLLNHQEYQQQQQQLVKDLPDSVDWRTYQIHDNHTNDGTTIVTPVKHQGSCGSCWAFASTTAMESHIALATNTLYTLSVQELVSCAPNPMNCGGTGGCQGSTAEVAMDFVATHGGMVEEWRFGYQSFNGTNDIVPCTIWENSTTTTTTTTTIPSRRQLQPQQVSHLNSNPILPNVEQQPPQIHGTVASITGFANLPSNDYYALLATVAFRGPVVVNIAAANWRLYDHGVFDDRTATTRDINHVVVVEGYGTDDESGQDFWLVRNSWGPTWGEDGYIRLRRVDPTTVDDDELEDECKLDVTTPDGIACTKTSDGEPLFPHPALVCGTSGILYDSILPLGGHLVQ